MAQYTYQILIELKAGDREIGTFHIDQNGIITDPGKFEREHFSARLFYEDAMQSFADEEDGDSCDGPGYYWLFNLEPGDSEKYGLDAGIVGVILSEGTTGFIGMTTFTDQDTLTSTWSNVQNECTSYFDEDGE